jgi:pimeloyl-ACP methyl ester carboxylesterase
LKSIFKSEKGKRIVLESYRKILSQWPVQNRQYEMETKYGSTFVIESGERNNPPLLLIHGSVSNSFTWFSDVIELSAGYNVYAVDIIGEPGLSAPERPQYESGVYEEWLKEVISGLNLESCCIAAISLGGWMALNFCVKYPETVRKLFLICPGGLSPENPEFIKKALLYSIMGKKGMGKILMLLNGGKMPEKTPGSEPAMELFSLMGRYFKPRTAKLPLFGKEQLSRLKMPVMMLFGEKDCMFFPEKSIENLKAGVPHAATELLAETGHFIIGQTKRMIDFFK